MYTDLRKFCENLIFIKINSYKISVVLYDVFVWFTLLVMLNSFQNLNIKFIIFALYLSPREKTNNMYDHQNKRIILDHRPNSPNCRIQPTNNLECKEKESVGLETYSYTGHEGLIVRSWPYRFSGLDQIRFGELGLVCV